MCDITFIIPTFNNKKLLFRCLKSIENQLGQNDKIIVVDDGSTDGTFEVLKKAYKLNSKLEIIKQVNSGSGVARNKGVLLNKNKYIWFIDSDDYIVADAVKKVRRKLSNNNIDILFFDFYSDIISEEKWNKSNFNSTDKISLMFSSHFPWNKVIKAELFKDVQFPSGRIRYQDHGTIPVIISKGKNIEYIKEPLYVYDFTHPNNIGKNSNKQDDIYIAFNNLIFYNKKEILTDLELEALFIYTFVFLRIYEPSDNSFASIYLNIKKVKKYLNENYPTWRKSVFLNMKSIDKYSKIIKHLPFKILMGNLLKWNSLIPALAIVLYKKLKN